MLLGGAGQRHAFRQWRSRRADGRPGSRHPIGWHGSRPIRVYEHGQLRRGRQPRRDHRLGEDPTSSMFAAINTNASVGGNQDFTFLGLGAADLTVGQGQLKYYQSGGNTYVVANATADNQADFQIKISGLHNLTADQIQGLANAVLTGRAATTHPDWNERQRHPDRPARRGYVVRTRRSGHFRVQENGQFPGGGKRQPRRDHRLGKLRCHQPCRDRRQYQHLGQPGLHLPRARRGRSDRRTRPAEILPVRRQHLRRGQWRPPTTRPTSESRSAACTL